MQAVVVGVTIALVAAAICWLFATVVKMQTEFAKWQQHCLDQCAATDREREDRKTEREALLKTLKFIDKNISNLCADRDIAHDAPPEHTA